MNFLNYEKLLAEAQKIVDNSTNPSAVGFDTRAWFEAWVQIPQVSLAGHTPTAVLDDSDGYEIVLRLLGCLESGSYL